MGSFDVVTFIFFIAAVVIFFQLRAVLGRKNDSDQSRIEQKRAQNQAPPLPTDDPKVVTLPNRNKDAEAEDIMASIDAYAKPDTDLNKALRAIKQTDPSFDPKEFVKGAGIAYEMIVSAYAEGDRKTLRNLLSREVYDGFVQAIDDRESRGETIRSEFVGIDSARIIYAETKGSEANITVRIICQLISATIDSNGQVVDGDNDEVSEVNDVWTFSRDTRSRDPNWRLIATEADH